MIVYKLQNMFIVTADTPRQPAVFSKNKGIELFTSIEKRAARFLYGAKIVCMSGVHRRIFFSEFNEMNSTLDKIISRQGFNNR